eukprot:Hpha_TRINITY_DN16801_c4_g7::TRINITY_DN16801_c4_g7_i1::g.149585::m.149585/K14407/CSTF2, RNA15; cleavage stimulation factor subunit 2
MAHQGENRQRLVHVAGIPPDVNEHDLRTFMEEVGAVKSVQLVYDPPRPGMPMKHRGFAFCEYYDMASKESALRNLPKRVLKGAHLRLRPADGGLEDAVKQDTVEQKEVPRMELDSQSPIAQALQKMPLSQVYEAMHQFREIVKEEPSKAHAVLTENPQLKMALLHVFHYMGILADDPETAQEVSERREKKRAAFAAAEAAGLPPPTKRARSGGSTPPPGAGPVGVAVEGGRTLPVTQQCVDEVRGLSVPERQALLALTDAQLGSYPPQERDHLIVSRYVIRMNMA